MATVTQTVTRSELESKTFLTLIAKSANESNISKTGFLSLSTELRHSILRQTVKLDELEEATHHVTDRFLTWDDFFNDHGDHIQTWATMLKLVHREIYADVDYVKDKWEEDFQNLQEERLVAYEEVARKRRAQFLDVQPRKLRVPRR